MKTFIMIASAVVLFSTAASANSVKIECRDNVERGTLKLTNPPIMNCDDFNLVKNYVGSGITVGPNSKVNDLISVLHQNASTYQILKPSRQDLISSVLF